MIYKWKFDGLYKSDPNEAGRVMNELKDTVGLTSATLLEASRPEDAPLHNEFEWDDSIAAEKFRKEQARHLICDIQVIVDESKNTEPVRAFVTLETQNKPRQFGSIVEVVADEDSRNALLDSALRELSWYRNKYEALKELAPVIVAIDEVNGKYGFGSEK